MKEQVMGKNTAAAPKVQAEKAGRDIDREFGFVFSHINVKQLHPLFVGEVTGVNVGEPLSSEEKTEIQRAIDCYGVLVFRDQQISDHQLADFAALFGPMQDISPFKKTGLTTESPYVGSLSNIDKEGNLLPPDHVKRGILDANKLWHTDGTYFNVKAAYSFLKPEVLPPVGGETEYCDTRIAYESLSYQMKEKVDSLVGEHCLLYSRTLTGFDISKWDEDQRALFPPPVARPLVHEHIGSGRKALCLASHIKQIQGIPEDEGRALVWKLIELATSPERVYQHQWKEGDLVMWDNRCLMHRGRPFEEYKHKRDMRSARVLEAEELKHAEIYATG